MAIQGIAGPAGVSQAGRREHLHAFEAGLKPTERLFIEKTLMGLYPRLQRHDLFPWALFNGPLIPDFLVRNTHSGLRRIVEIGCGDGVLSNVLSLLFPHIEIIGIDTDARKIARAKATVGYRKNLKFICGNPATMTEIPCDRIIYSHTLSDLKNSHAFRKLMIKTLDWLVNEGDFILRESPLALLSSWQLIQENVPRLQGGRSPEACLRGYLAELGYANPIIYSYGRVPGLPSEIFYRSPKTLTLTAMMAKPVQKAAAEWHDIGDQSNDSVVGFLFANQETDFTQELCP